MLLPVSKCSLTFAFLTSFCFVIPVSFYLNPKCAVKFSNFDFSGSNTGNFQPFSSFSTKNIFPYFCQTIKQMVLYCVCKKFHQFSHLAFRRFLGAKYFANRVLQLQSAPVWV